MAIVLKENAISEALQQMTLPTRILNDVALLNYFIISHKHFEVRVVLAYP